MDFIPLKPRRTDCGNQLPQRVSGQGRIAHHAQRNTVCLELFERAYQWQVRHEAFAFHRGVAWDPFGQVGGVDMDELEQAGGDALEPDFTPRGDVAGAVSELLDLAPALRERIRGELGRTQLETFAEQLRPFQQAMLQRYGFAKEQRIEGIDTKQGTL